MILPLCGLYFIPGALPTLVLKGRVLGKVFSTDASNTIKIIVVQTDIILLTAALYKLDTCSDKQSFLNYGLLSEMHTVMEQFV